MHKIMQSLVELPVSRVISGQDGMFRVGDSEHYFSVGLSSIYAITIACQIGHGTAEILQPIRDILDFGCGHGRVARWLRAAFPDANTWCDDIDRGGVQFCSEALGCKPLAAESPPPKMDIIWLGSVFTHLPIEGAKSLLDFLVALLKPGGLLIFSAHGRYSRERLRGYDWTLANQTPWVNYQLDKDSMERVCRAYDRSGYGYEDYPGQNGYGISMVEGKWYARACHKRGLRQVYAHERGYDNHQDLYGFINLGILDGEITPLRLAAKKIEGIVA